MKALLIVYTVALVLLVASNASADWQVRENRGFTYYEDGNVKAFQEQYGWFMLSNLGNAIQVSFPQFQKADTVFYVSADRIVQWYVGYGWYEVTTCSLPAMRDSANQARATLNAAIASNNPLVPYYEARNMAVDRMYTACRAISR